MVCRQPVQTQRCLLLWPKLQSLCLTPLKQQIKVIHSHYRGIEKVNSNLLPPPASKTNGYRAVKEYGRRSVTEPVPLRIDNRRALDRGRSSLWALLFRPFFIGIAWAFFGSVGGSTFHSHAKTPNLTFSGFLCLLSLLALAYLTNCSCSHDLTLNTRELTFQSCASASK